MGKPAPPLSLLGIYKSLRAPTVRDAVYSLKAFAAAGLSLWAAFSMNLENPYWSALTVYMLVNPPGAGAIRTKCGFRLGGTLIGGLLVLAVTGLFGDQLGILLAATIAIIVVTAFVFQIDKTPSNYLWLAIGITAAVTVLNNLLHPERLYDVMVARVTEISLGILVTAAVDCFAPEPITPSFLKTMAGWCGKAREFAIEAIQPTVAPGSDTERRGKLLELIKGIQAIDGKAVQLPFDVVARPPRARDLDLLRRQVVATVGDLVAVELRVRALSEPDRLTSSVTELREAVISWLQAEPDLPKGELDAHIERGRRLAGELETARDGFGAGTGTEAHMQVLRGLLARLAAFLNDWCDLLLALRAVETGARLCGRLERIAAGARPVRSIDYLGTALDVAPLLLAMTVTSVIWYLTAWDSGPTALLFSWGATIFLLGQGQIVQSMAGMLFCVLTAMGLVFLFQFVVLPRIADFPILIGVLGCALLPLGLLMAMNMAGMLIVGMMLSFLALQSVYHADFAQSLQTLFALLIGMLVSVISLRVCSYDRAQFAMRRLAAAVRRDVVDVARLGRTPDRDRLRFLGFYRLSLYFPAAEQAAAGQPQGLLGDLGIGFNLLTLRRWEAAASTGARELIVMLRKTTAATFQEKLAGRDDGGKLEALVNSAMNDPAIHADPAGDPLLDALTGLHLALGVASAPVARGATR